MRRSFVFILAAFLALTALAPPARSQSTPSAQTTQDDYNAGLKLYSAKDYTDAVLYFDAAIRMDPNNVPALLARADCYYSEKRYQQALSDYRKVLVLQPQNTQVAQFIQAHQAEMGKPSETPAWGNSPSEDPVKDLKSPFLSFLFSAVVPGTGQYYNGTSAEINKGHIQDLGIVCGIVLIYVGAENAAGSNAGPTAAPGFLMIAGCYLWSIIDAPISSADINGEIGKRRTSNNLNMSFTLLNDPALRPFPVADLSLRF